MPYGSYQPPRRSNGNVTQLYGSSYQNGYDVVSRYPQHGKVTYVRSGSNRPKGEVKANVVRRRPDGPLEWRLVTIPAGPRLPYKVYSKRLQKYVWARQPIKVPRLVRTWKKNSPKKKRGMNLPSNPLSFSSACVSYFGDDITITSKDTWNPPGPLLVAKGCLWTPFLPVGAGYVAGVNADNYVGSGISSRFSSYTSKADQIAVGRLYERVKQQEVNLAQALAERRQTAQLFYELCKRLLGFWIKLKRGQLSAALGKLLPGNVKGVANDHLAIQYGIRPLLSDLEGISKVLMRGEDVYFDIIVRRREEVPRGLVSSFSGASGLLRFTDTVYSHGYTEVKYKYRCLVPSPSDSVLRTFTKLGFGNLNSLAWELIPFSFVVDWALPIGQYLNSMDAFDNIQIVDASKTVFSKEYIEFRRVFGGSVGYRTVSTGTCGFVNERVSCVRTILSKPPVLPGPSLKDPVSAMHIANALALLVQLRK